MEKQIRIAVYTWQNEVVAVDLDGATVPAGGWIAQALEPPCPDTGCRGCLYGQGPEDQDCTWTPDLAVQPPDDRPIAACGLTADYCQDCHCPQSSVPETVWPPKDAADDKGPEKPVLCESCQHLTLFGCPVLKIFRTPNEPACAEHFKPAAPGVAESWRRDYPHYFAEADHV